MNLKKYYNKTYKSKMKDDHRLQYANRILKEVKKYKKKGKLLELGSYDGSFIGESLRQGFNAWGIDINPYKTKNPRVNTRTIKGEIRDLKQYKNKCFDIIIAFNILEHVLVPAETLEGMKRILKDDGIMIISVPNIDTLIGFDKIVCGQHINYFNYNCLKAQCQRLNLKIVYVQTRLITSFLYKYLNRRKSAILTKTYNPRQKNILYDNIYKTLERLDRTKKGIDLMIHIRK